MFNTYLVSTRAPIIAINIRLFFAYISTVRERERERFISSKTFGLKPFFMWMLMQIV